MQPDLRNMMPLSYAQAADMLVANLLITNPEIKIEAAAVEVGSPIPHLYLFTVAPLVRSMEKTTLEDDMTSEVIRRTAVGGRVLVRFNQHVKRVEGNANYVLLWRR